MNDSINNSANNKTNIPAYLKLYQRMRDDIINGYYSYGSKLPSKRILASETGFSLITIKHSMELLTEEGYIEPRERSGYFVIFTKDDFFGAPTNISHSKEKINKVSSDDMIPYTVLAKTMRKVILDYENQLYIKSPNQGCNELRSEIRSYLARSRSIHVKPDQVIIGSGAEYLYSLIAQFWGHSAEFAIENPSYEKIHKVYESFNIKVNLLTLNADGIDSRELKETKATVLHTTPFNSYPSGISINSSKKHEYLRWATKRNGVIIEDNFDSELTVSRKAEESLFSMSGGEKVVYINTFTRTIAPSLRLGYMILPENMVDAFNDRLGFYSCTVPVFDQYVIAELLRNGDFERHINRVRRKRRKLLNDLGRK